jgi:leucyl-tRNA synthetase
MDTFVDSAWYWLRYLDPKNSKRYTSFLLTSLVKNYFHLAISICDPSKASRNLNVDVYIGGLEHAILHLLYARFIGKFLHDQGMACGPSMDSAKGEPFQSLLTQGMVHAQTARCPKSGRYLKPEEVEWIGKEISPTSSESTKSKILNKLLDSSTAKIKATGESSIVTWEKMSKSKYNGIDPSVCLSFYA